MLNVFSDLGFFDKEKKKFNPFKIKLRLFNPNKLMKTDSVFIKLLNYMTLFGCPLIFIAGIVINRIFIDNSIEFYGQVMTGISELGISNWVLIVFLSLISLALHECAHMVTARKYGVNVPEMGVMLYFLIPCAYTNISGINLLKSKAQRLIVLVSGSLVNFAIIGICNITMCTTNSKELVSYAAAVVLANIGTIFLNLMVLLKFDGYYVLEAILDEPKLRENALSSIIAMTRTAFAGKKEDKVAFRQMIDKSENILKYIMYSVYFVFSTGYIPVINRQLLFDNTDIGRDKAEVLKEKLSAVNFGITIETVNKQICSEEDLEKICTSEKFDLIVKALDTPTEIPVWLDNVAQRNKLTYVSGITMRENVLIGPSFVPDISKHGMSELLNLKNSGNSEKLYGTSPSMEIMLYNISDELA